MVTEKTPSLIEGKRYSCVDFDLRMLMESVAVRGVEFGGDTHFTNHNNEEVFFSYSLYKTKEKALDWFNKEKSEAKEVLRRKSLKNSQDTTIGRKIVFYSEKDFERAADIEKRYNVVWIKDSKLYSVSSESLKAIEEIEKDCNLD